MRNTALHRSLRRVWSAVRLSEATAATAACLSALLALVLLVVLVDATVALPPLGLVVADVALVGVAAAVVVVIVATLVRYRYAPRRVARLIERRLDWSDSRLINAVDLHDAVGAHASDALRTLAVERGATAAIDVRRGRVCDLARLRRRLLAAGLALVVTAGAVVLFPGAFEAVGRRLLKPSGHAAPYTLLEFDISVAPTKAYRGRPVVISAALSGPAALPDQANVVFSDERGDTSHVLPMLQQSDGRFTLRLDDAGRSRWFYIDTPDGRSRRRHLKVYAVPTFERVFVRYAYPAYTGWDDGSSVLEAGRTDVKCLVGTQVTLRVQSNQPLSGGTLTLSGDDEALRETVVLRPTDEPAVVEGHFVAERSGTYRIAIRNRDGISADRDAAGKVVCVADELPRVEIRTPEPALIVPADWHVDVEVAAWDDVAVDRIELYRGVNGWGPTPVDLELERSDPTHAAGTLRFDLPALGARPGDVITYFATAHDVHPAGGRFSDSRTHVVRVISVAQYRTLMRTRYRMRQIVAELDALRSMLAAAERQRDTLAEDFAALKAEVDADGWTEERKEALQDLARRQRDYAMLLDKTRAALRDKARMPGLWGQAEARMRRELEAVADALTPMAEASHRAASDALAASPADVTDDEAGRQLDHALARLGADARDGKKADRRLNASREKMDLLRRADEMVGLVSRLQAMVSRQRQLADRLAMFRNRERLSSSEQLRARRLGQQQAELEKELAETLKVMNEAAERSADQLPKMSASVAELAGAVEQLNVRRDQTDAAALAVAGHGRYAHRAAEAAADKLESLCSQCVGQVAANARGDLDKPLGLSGPSLKSLLSSMVGSLQMSASGIGGGGQGEGGFYGSAAPTALHGPHARGGEGHSRDGAARDASHARGRGRGRGRARGAAAARPVESLRPTQRTDSPEVRALPGVPARYRDTVEAYFRRLA
ncbi:MAG: hypothetical protein KGY99_10735, partial [Phycisphaerae bacterium]|nr:hypothetical protein [Phycisphaerae bacterium]